MELRINRVRINRSRPVIIVILHFDFWNVSVNILHVLKQIISSSAGRLTVSKSQKFERLGGLFGERANALDTNSARCNAIMCGRDII